MRNRIFAILAIFAVPSCVTTEGVAFSVAYTPGGKAVVRLIPPASYAPIPAQVFPVPAPDASLLPTRTK